MRQSNRAFSGRWFSTRQVLRYVVYFGLVLLAGWSTGAAGTAWAVPKETSTEKAEHLRQQANPQLFNHWTFDKDQVGSVPSGFIAVASGDQQHGGWKVEAQAAVPSSPNMLVGTSGCESCRAILVAQGFQYEYPELVVRIQQPTDGGSGQVGVVFGMKDPQNYYATIVDISQKMIQVVRVIEGKESVIGRAPIKSKPVDWHTLRCSAIRSSVRTSWKHFLTEAWPYLLKIRHLEWGRWECWCWDRRPPDSTILTHPRCTQAVPSRLQRPTEFQQEWGRGLRGSGAA